MIQTWIIQNKKAFISIFTIFFICVFLLIISSNRMESINDFIIIDQAKIQKQSELLNLETIIENSLQNPEDNPEIIKQITNNIVYDHTLTKDFYVYDKITTQKEKLTLSELNNLSRVIVYKPNNNVTIKKYILTNGILQNKSISFDIETNKYQTTEILQNNYEVSVIVYS